MTYKVSSGTLSLFSLTQSRSTLYSSAKVLFLCNKVTFPPFTCTFKLCQSLQVIFSKKSCHPTVSLWLSLVVYGTLMLWLASRRLPTVSLVHIVTQWSGSGGTEAYLRGQLASFSVLTLAVGWVIWPVKIVPEMTYKVSSGTLNLCSINYVTIRQFTALYYVSCK